MIIRLSLATLLLLGIYAPLGAQVVRPPQGGLGVTPAIEPFEVSGALQAISQGKIKLVGMSGRQLIVAVGPQTRIELTGTATPDFLAPGMYVRFQAEFDEHGTAKDKVSQLTIFTPSRGMPLGIQPLGDGAAEATAGQDKPDKPAAASAASKRRSKAAPAFSPGMYGVAAPISGVQDGKLTVGSGNAALKFEVADDAKIDVHVTDLRFARPGDKATVKGRMFAGQQAKADQVKIEASVPFSDPRAKQAKPAAKPSAKTAPKHEPQPTKKPPPGKEPTPEAK